MRAYNKRRLKIAEFPSNVTANNKKKKPHNPIWFGLVALVLIAIAIVFNAASDYLLPTFFPKPWRAAFNKGIELAKTDRPAGLKAMEDAFAQCQKDDIAKNKAVMCYDFATWYYNEGQPGDIAQAKKLYGKCITFWDDITQQCMSYSRMADCDYYAGVHADGVKNAELTLKMRNSGAWNDPPSMWCTYMTLGQAYQAAGLYEKAESAFKSAVESGKRADVYKGWAPLEANRDLACTYALDGKRELGDKLIVTTVADMDKLKYLGCRESDRAIAFYARALKESGDQEAAAQVSQRLDDPRMVDYSGPYWTYWSSL